MDNNRTDSNVAPLTVGEGASPLTVGGGEINTVNTSYDREDMCIGMQMPIRRSDNLDEGFLHVAMATPAEITVRSGDINNTYTYGTLFSNPTFKPIMKVLAGMSIFMAVKNLKYGNSALDPIRVFSKSSIEEQILVRLDDKMSRLRSRTEPELAKNDVIDIMGYLILYAIHKKWFDYRDLLD